MNNTRKAIALLVLAGFISGGSAFAQEHHDDQTQDRRDDHAAPHSYVKHDEWKKGYHMKHEDWDRGNRVDYRTYHLRRPPNGYEWREVDGNYVLGAVATGIIASVVVASSMH